MNKSVNVEQFRNNNQNVTIWILAFIMIILIIAAITMMSGPRNIEKYMNRVYKLREQYEQYDEDDFKNRKKISKKLKNAWIRLAKNIQHNLIRIMKHNKTVDGDLIIVDDTERFDGIDRLKSAKLSETTMSEGTHTIDKKFVKMCDVNHPDDNTLAHVLIHEFAHVINSTIGHDQKWTRLFNILQDVADKEGWFNKNKRIELDTYCGARYTG